MRAPVANPVGVTHPLSAKRLRKTRLGWLLSRVYSRLMANYQMIVRHRPEVRDFIRNRRWVHRGDVIAYGPNTSCSAFSTDGAGFRHTVFRGETLSVKDCLQRKRYGLVLGSSNLYGFGLAGNENTIPSVLSERLGFPFANVSLPEATSRNLCSLLVAILARTPKAPAIVLHLSGGDFTSFCYTSIADPVFGSPNLKQMRMAGKERGGRPAPETQIDSLLAFTSLWNRTIVQLCQGRRIPLVLGNDTTFFEKREPNEVERQCALGQATNEAQKVQFDIHQRFVPRFYGRRSELAGNLGVILAGPGHANSLGFVDEFHYDREGVRMLSEDFAVAISQQLGESA